MEKEFEEGKKALERFEEGMKKLFRASKPASPFTPPPPRPKEELSKD